MRSRYELEMEEHDKHITWMTKNGGFARDMTLRDHYVGLAMQSFIAEVFAGHLADHGYDSVARRSYDMADAMLAAREGK